LPTSSSAKMAVLPDGKVVLFVSVRGSSSVGSLQFVVYSC